MTIGLIGLGRMGQAIAARLVHSGIAVVGYDPFTKEVDLSLHGRTLADQNLFIRAQTVAGVAHKLPDHKGPHIYWIMVPHGKPVDDVINELLPHIKKGDILIDGGNTFYQDTVRRYEFLKEKSIHYLDCGTSGGLHGREIGFCLMLGGDREPFDACRAVLDAVATNDSYQLLGPSGAGHYVKTVHNGIEYGLLQAYAEGFHVLKKGHYKELDLAQISQLWNHGSIIRSWILTLANNVFKRDQNFDDISGAIGENLTGLWTFQEADRHTIPVEVIKAALDVRASSRRTGGNYATKVVSLLRHEFGGHPVTFVEIAKRD